MISSKFLENVEKYLVSCVYKFLSDKKQGQDLFNTVFKGGLNDLMRGFSFGYFWICLSIL